MTEALRHRCRNPQCRSKLREPVENAHHAFCQEACFNRFYHKRCLACEKSLRTARRAFCPAPAKCANQVRTWPQKYRWPGYCRGAPRKAHSTGLKYGISGHPPRAYCLRHWWWGDPGIGDCSLYDAEGLTRARIVLRYLRSPIATPAQHWDGQGAGEHIAESIALASLPLDRQTAARIRRDNSSPHPMGPPLERSM
jgi:hypothetical protein